MAERDLVIRVEGVRKTYVTGKTEVHALRGVSVAIERGEMVAIMGASGSGKSTLMNILGCLDRPTAGSFWLDGVRVDGMTKNELADIRNAKIGFVFQGFNLLARTSALENVELPLLYHRGPGKPDTKALSRAALERVGLGDRLDHEPSELSGGQQQRVAIARALAMSPALVLADEPSGNLDTENADAVFDLMRDVNETGGTTFLIVTHDPRLAQRCDRIVELVDGRIVRDRPNPNVVRRG
jgi:putative ABC transport system ATP-binding protein